MKDHFTNGWIAGVAAGASAAIFNLIINWLFDIGAKHFIDFAEVLIFGHRAHNLAEFGLAFVGYLLFTGILGVIFAYLLPVIRFRYHLFKSLVFSLAVWFMVYAIVLLLKAPVLTEFGFDITFNNFVTASVFGLALNFFYFRLLRYEDMR